MTVLAAIKRAWKALDYVPNCPCCEGTGLSKRDYENGWIWWQGRQVLGCWHCDGRGKV